MFGSQLIYMLSEPSSSPYRRPVRAAEPRDLLEEMDVLSFDVVASHAVIAAFATFK